MFFTSIDIFHLTSFLAAFFTSGSCIQEIAAGSSGCELQQDRESAIAWSVMIVQAGNSLGTAQTQAFWAARS